MKNELFEEEELNTAVPQKRGAWYYAKKTLKYVFYAIMTMAWVSVLLVIFLRRDDPLVSTPVLSERARSIYESSPETFEFYRVYPAEFMSEEGAFQLKNCVYAASAGEYEIGLRTARTQLRYCRQCGRLYTPNQLEQQKKFDEEDDPHSCTALGHELVRASDTDKTLSYRIFDSEGAEYELTGKATRTKKLNFGFFKIEYEYLRLAYGGLYFDLDSNIINRESSVDIPDADDASAGYGVSETETGSKRWYFAIYDAETDDRLFATCIYDDSTYIEEQPYVLPDEDYLRG